MSVKKRTKGPPGGGGGGGEFKTEASYRPSIAADARAMSALTTEEKMKIAAMFKKLDKNENGVLDKMELIVGLSELGHPEPSLETVEGMLAAVGLGDTTEVTLEDFEIMWKNKPASSSWSFSALGDDVLGGFFGGAARASGDLLGGVGGVIGMPLAAAGLSMPFVGDMVGGSPKGKPILSPPFREVYALGKQVGSGAYSTVHIAQKAGDPSVDYAVKVVQKKDVPDKEDVDALLDEVGILQQIHHPNVRRLYEFYEDKSSYALVTEMVVGGELFDRVVELQHYSEATAQVVPS